MISWMVFDLTHFLLLGRQSGPEPPFGLCLAQASLIYMIPVLASFACAALVLQLYHSIYSLIDIGFSPRLEGRLMYILLFAPCTFGTLVFIEALLYGLSHPEKVMRSNSGMICRITNGIPSKISAAFVVTALVISMVLEIVVFITLYRNWRAFRALNQAPYPSIVRITIAFLLGVVSIIISVILSLQEGKKDQETTLGNARADIIIETSEHIILHLTESELRLTSFVPQVPLSAAIVFGTQKDMLQAWMFWKGSKRPQNVASPTISVSLVKFGSPLV
ncbi:hypothetical protein D9758_007336 [Tetrapyrgos nigripes]|uniref:Uncharacterized protein n=1 Tax=Tetrapyrgos nigripes TaxID=182062 RepID=A0A8H5LLJ6_9AGAR|nr:hypothetical protein D9758_007336 [Tetrapyrgos nigripes]